MKSMRIATTRLQILWLLSKSSLTGKQIVSGLSKLKGLAVAHPNIYTSLRAMEKAGFVSSKRSGRSVTWSITKKGRKELMEMANMLIKSIDGMIEEIKCSRCIRKCR